MQVQAAERAQAEEKQRELALQEVQNEQVAPWLGDSCAYCCRYSKPRCSALDVSTKITGWMASLPLRSVKGC